MPSMVTLALRSGLVCSQAQLRSSVKETECRDRCQWDRKAKNHSEEAVELSQDRDYVHRPNPDGTLDTICLYCFRTVALHQSQNSLGASEAQHTCPLKEKKQGNPFKLAGSDE